MFGDFGEHELLAAIHARFEERKETAEKSGQDLDILLQQDVSKLAEDKTGCTAEEAYPLVKFSYYVNAVVAELLDDNASEKVMSALPDVLLMTIKILQKEGKFSK